MVVIRLARRGTKKRPFYHVVAADSRCKRDGRFIEKLGFYNPIAKGEEENLRLDSERVGYWLGNGAKPSDTVFGLIKRWKKANASEQASAN
jgi:small subunit ribosomal protein S16